MKSKLHNARAVTPAQPHAATRRARAIGVWGRLQTSAAIPDAPMSSTTASASPSPWGERRGEGGRSPTAHAPVCSPAFQARAAFTLIEMLIGMAVFAVVLVVVHSVFYGALQLRNKSIASLEHALPLQHALAVIKRDLVNLTPPGGMLTGPLQTTPTTTSSTSLTHPGQQIGPIFYTASGAVNESTPWSELRKVSYYLMPASSNAPGRLLVRSVTRNLLPVLSEEYEDQTLLGNVEDMTFEFYNGTAWVNTWDSASGTLTTTSNALPVGIRASLTLVNPQSGVPDAVPIELIVPVFAQPGTNSTASTTGGGQ